MLTFFTLIYYYYYKNKPKVSVYLIGGYGAYGGLVCQQCQWVVVRVLTMPMGGGFPTMPNGGMGMPMAVVFHSFPSYNTTDWCYNKGVQFDCV